MVVEHQHQIRNALHEHLGLGGTPLPCGGGDLSGGQRRNERFFPQYLLCHADAPPDRAGKERPHGVKVELVRQRRIQQLQIRLAFHLGVKVGRCTVEGHALHKGVDGRAALCAGHAGLL